jgi:hypothetical protein
VNDKVESVNLQPFSASDLLNVWERGAGLPPVAQALAILAAAFPGVPADRLVHLSIGQRDACLLRLRELTFGPHLNGLAVCPSCGERLEMAFEAADLCKGDASLPDLEATPAATTASLTSPPYEVTFRLPDSADLNVISGMEDPLLARQQLLQSCLLSVSRDGHEIPTGELPAEVLEAVTERMTQSEPLADLTLALTCPACGHSWQMLFDIVSFFWSEINAWSARLLREVHILASAYGWREADILAMSAWRRQRYLEMVGL